MDEVMKGRREIAAMLTEMGFKTSPKTLAKLASIGGGPEYQVFGNKAIYRPSKALEWAQNRLSAPRRSTSGAV
jgi:hypothetical protein